MTTEIQHENKTSIITRLNESFADLEFVSLESDEEGIRVIVSNNRLVGTFELSTSFIISSHNIELNGSNELSGADEEDFDRKLSIVLNILIDESI